MSGGGKREVVVNEARLGQGQRGKRKGIDRCGKARGEGRPDRAGTER